MNMMFQWLCMIAIGSIAGSFFYRYWIRAAKRLEKQNEYFTIYRMLRRAVLFYILPGPVFCLLRSMLHPFLYQMRQTAVPEDGLFGKVIWILAAVWLAGAGFVLIRTVRNCLYVRRIMHANTEISDPGQIACFEEICRRLKFYRTVRVYENSCVQTPIIVGPLKNNILFPAGRYCDREFAIILEHEIIHAKHRDLFVQSLLTWLSVPYWFVPAVKKERVAMEDWCETACDITMCSSDTSVWSKKEYFRPMVTHMPVEPVGVMMALAFNTDQLELMVRMKRLKAYDAVGHREITEITGHQNVYRLLAACIAVAAVFACSFYLKNEAYVNLAQHGTLFRQAYQHSMVQKNEYMEAGTDCHSRWIYCKAGESLVLTVDYGVQGEENRFLYANIHRAGEGIFKSYYLSDQMSQRCDCQITEDGFYRVEFSPQSDRPYHLIYQIGKY